MAYPVYEGNGGAAARTGTFIDVTYPSTSENDILLLFVEDFGADTFITPTDWGVMGTETYSGIHAAMYWLRSDGTESGNLRVNGNGAGKKRGWMARVSGCITTGTPYEDFTAQGGETTDTPTIPEFTTTGIERLGWCFYGSDDGGTSLSNYSPWINAVTGTTRQWGFHRDIATASTVSELTIDASSSKVALVYACGLIPIAGAVDNLTSTDIETESPDVDDATLSQTHILTGNDVETQNSEVVNATLGQEHILSSDDIESQNPEIGTPTLQEVDVLEADSIESQNPVIEDSDIGQVHALLSSIIESGSPIIENADLGQEHALISNDINTLPVVIGTPTLAEAGTVDNLIATDIETSAPIIQVALLRQIHDILTDDIETKNPIIGTPTFGENIIFIPFIKRDRICDNAETTFIPVIDRKRCVPLTSTPSNALNATNIIAGNPVIGMPDIGSIHNLLTNNIESGNTLISSPILDERILITMDMSTPSPAGFTIEFAAGDFFFDFKEGAGKQAFTSNVELSNTYTTPGTYIGELSGPLELITKFLADNSKITFIENLKGDLIDFRINDNLYVGILDMTNATISEVFFIQNNPGLIDVLFASSGNSATAMTIDNTGLVDFVISNVPVKTQFLAIALPDLETITFAPSGNTICPLFRIKSCPKLINLNLVNVPIGGTDVEIFPNSILEEITFANSGNGSLHEFRIDSNVLNDANNLDTFSFITNDVMIFQNNSMPASGVNHILVDLASIVSGEGVGGDYTGRTIHGGTTNAAPDGTSGGYDGLTAKALLQSKGVTVNTS